MAITLILPSLILGAFLAFALYNVASLRFAPPASGKFIGEEAEAIDKLDPKGYVLFSGEYWLAEAEETVEKGEEVVVLARNGAVLKVKRK
jgi:membrane-bound serine protease (ClpP class)